MRLDQLAFHSHANRTSSEHLKACWLFTQRVIGHRELLEEAPIFCCICSEVTNLAASDASLQLDMREGMTCARCGSSARQRVAVAMLAAVAGADDRIYVTEQSTPLYAVLQSRYPKICGSEFEPGEERRREMASYLASLGGTGEINFEDVTRLGMADASQDVVLSFDVLEHVPDYRAALREFARVLRPGGVLQATFPFTDRTETIMRASLREDGSIEHHLEPEYHGDPIGGPVLCFYHFGWDILQTAREAGFASARMTMAWAPEEGVLYGHWVLVATV